MTGQPVKASPLRLDGGQSIIIWEVQPPPRPLVVHVHRWAWTVTGRVECYDCGVRR